MATKLEQKAFPAGHGPNDFQCFGPAATKDGQFDGTMISDMGCFTQDGKDSNKYYHAAVVQSKKDQRWYAYFEWGRTGAANPAFQFVVCGSKQEAQEEYESQLHSKNDKRGEWIQHSTLGRMLRARSGKDCYLVRPQATRSTGLPDAKTITQNEGAKPKPLVEATKPGVKAVKNDIDAPTMSLMRDLNVGTVQYTRSSMADSAIPTQAAIDEGRLILTEAQKRIRVVGDNVDTQVNDMEIKHLTSAMYGRIPKVKARNAPPETWILSSKNIATWMLDLDTFESALNVTDMGERQSDPFGGMKIKMRHLTPRDPVGEFIYSWMPKATRNMHGDVGRMRIRNAWFVERDNDAARLTAAQKIVLAQSGWRVTAPPLHQPPRHDLTADEGKLFTQTNTCLLFHGTRSVNVSGLLRESWRLPSDLVGVTITAWMFGPGSYWADDWKKSAGYTSLGNSRYAHGGGGIQSRGAFMFVADVVLGASYIAPGASGFTAAPRGFHSVCGKMGHTKGWGGPLLNNEFITYRLGASSQDKLVSQCRARYLVEFIDE